MGLKITLLEIVGRLSVLILVGGIYKVVISNADRVSYDFLTAGSITLFFILGSLWCNIPLIKYLNNKSEEVKE